MVRWLRWHCPPDTGFEIRALAVWGRARYATSRSRRLPTILTFTRGWGRNNFVSFKPPGPGTLAWMAAVLTTTPEPPPKLRVDECTNPFSNRVCYNDNKYFSIDNENRDIGLCHRPTCSFQRSRVAEPCGGKMLSPNLILCSNWRSKIRYQLADSDHSV